MLVNLVVVYKGAGKIAADQLKKLVSQKDDKDSTIIGSEDGTVEIIAMDEKVYNDNSKTSPYNDPTLFIDDVKASQEIIPIAKPKQYGFGVICGFAGPQAVLTVKAKAVSKADEYNKFIEELNSLTFQQISMVPRGFRAVLDSLGHGVKGYLKRKEDIRKQQIIYGVTKFYYEDLHDFMKSYGKYY